MESGSKAAGKIVERRWTGHGLQGETQGQTSKAGGGSSIYRELTTDMRWLPTTTRTPATAPGPPALPRRPRAGLHHQNVDGREWPGGGSAGAAGWSSIIGLARARPAGPNDWAPSSCTSAPPPWPFSSIHVVVVRSGAGPPWE